MLSVVFMMATTFIVGWSLSEINLWWKCFIYFRGVMASYDFSL